MTTPGMSNQSSRNIESYPSKLNSVLQKFKLGGRASLKILCHVANFLLSLPLSHAQLAKKRIMLFHL
jgi:hypothetical protein